ncbi:UDP-N-acetylmuramoyl-L-alanine--D-glutamate ligase [Polymorphobacter fuscus]|uniref:UDP-N-acetylmuramoylalanine--D-glutamate ligase n=1 Tax=Sandarakinorhabdus fusca TaxID=1439888 RepID=A0A7C9GX27_9SPHN|nr:UDP-N-acetylmuramoyl-L-alanine--D-glutamate ligase [Polymorphobacter fuscus]KAB7644463.1 UDP-N-acetylmuramoyl-L-alanine--D-glutamate ligase [Polymorphobacter fuscus]MQT18389.1 UDP-N-acetylmuramoyl-L-alanine--D-glutamate ligase [Polymorphobacter fuscus]NJC08289.1 UDP-N-acetylmuramoylalanine--D-glutamate ligase [Polymorphobacter fuscus]
MITAPAFAGKTYGVFGLARSGVATVAALTASGAATLNWDDGEAARARFDGTVTNLHDTDLAALDALIVSPGVPHDAPLFAKAVAAAIPVIGDIELFAQARAALPPHKVVGITGTNGKSTTTALVHHILTAAGRPARMGGNIGLPILSQEPLPDHGVYVLELSSYQLDLTFSLDCDVAVLLNITPDHLDRHGSMAAYVAAKARLFAMQSPGRAAIVGALAEADFDVLDGAEDPVITFIEDVDIGPQADWPALQGPHNLQNARAAAAACAALGLDGDAIAAGLASYPGLAHRMERIATRNGVLYVNDSKATNPDSSAPALAAFPRTHWIAGGRAKGADLDAVLPHLGGLVAAYLIGEAAPVFAPILQPHVPVVMAGTLDAAVAAATAAARAGDTVLLSPACASFDQFRDFEQRGDAFRALVEAL